MRAPSLCLQMSKAAQQSQVAHHAWPATIPSRPQRTGCCICKLLYCKDAALPQHPRGMLDCRDHCCSPAEAQTTCLQHILRRIVCKGAKLAVVHLRRSLQMISGDCSSSHANEQAQARGFAQQAVHNASPGVSQHALAAAVFCQLFSLPLI